MMVTAVGSVSAAVNFSSASAHGLRLLRWNCSQSPELGRVCLPAPSVNWTTKCRRCELQANEEASTPLQSVQPNRIDLSTLCANSSSRPINLLHIKRYQASEVLKASSFSSDPSRCFCVVPTQISPLFVSERFTKFPEPGEKKIKKPFLFQFFVCLFFFILRICI